MATEPRGIPVLAPEARHHPFPEELRHVVNCAYSTHLTRAFIENFGLLRLPESGSHIWFARPQKGDGPTALMVSGPVLSPLLVRHPFGPLEILGLQLRPSATATVLGTSASRLQGMTLPLAACWGTKAELLEKRLRRETRLEACLGLLCDAVESSLATERPGHAIVSEAVRRMEDAPGLSRIETIARALDVSSRHLQRLFFDHVGCSPKQVARLVRLSKLLTRLPQSPSVPWAELAAELDYTDQSHLIADFRALVGETPQRFASRPPGLLRHVEIGWLLTPSDPSLALATWNGFRPFSFKAHSDGDTDEP